MIRFPVSPPKVEALLNRMDVLDLSEGDLDEMFFRPTQGKQRRRKSQTGVHLYCRRFDLHIRCQKSTSQALNRFFARRELVERLEQKQAASADPPKPATEECDLTHMHRMFSHSYEQDILKPYPLSSKRLTGGSAYPDVFMKALSGNKPRPSKDSPTQKRPRVQS